MVWQPIDEGIHDDSNKIRNSPESSGAVARHLVRHKLNVTIFKTNLRRTRKISIVLIYAWLFMNTDPNYAARTLGSMMASRILSRSLLRPLDGVSGIRSGNGGGLSTVEAIALIQAINSNNRGSQQVLDANSLKSDLGGLGSRSQLAREIAARQLPVPVPRPVPSAVIIAFITAFFAAVAAGSSPINAFFAAFVALIIAIVINKPEKKYDKALIKKLVIKKSAFPFVIPIPIPIPFPIPYGKGKSEVIYKYVPKPEHHHHEKKHKYKKSDDFKEKQSQDELDRIENLMTEQDRIQKVVDKVVKYRESNLVSNSERVRQNLKATSLNSGKYGDEGA